MADASFPGKILIVDADKSVAQALKGPLEKQGIKVDSAADLGSALYMYNQATYPVVLIDIAFEELPGLVLVQRWRQHENTDRANAGFIIIAGNRNKSDAGEERLVQELDDLEIVFKPINPIAVLALLKKVMGIRQRRLRFKEVSDQANKLASHPKTVPAAVEFVKSNAKDLGVKGQDLLREVYEIQLQWQSALDVVDTILKQKPEQMSALNNKGRLLLKLGQTEEALKFMEQADKQAPNNIDRINEMAIAFLIAKKPDASVEKMRQMMKFHPDRPDMKFELFGKLQEFGYDEHAIKLCKDTTSPIDVVRHYNNKGVALAKNNNVEGAIMEYERALTFFPKFKENYRILYNIAMAHLSYKNRSHYEIALDYVKRCLELNPKFDKALKTKEQITTQLGKGSPKAS
ncbi:MAG: response regulator [Oligoflexus sp.]|nr:response regulator [Oligoflexus sp.]